MMDGIWELTDVLKQSGSRSTEAIPATVTRVDNDGTVWVHLPGGADETPATGMNVANVRAGDTVGVSISGNQASIVGNASSPAVGSREVSEAVEPVAQQVAEARQVADIAQQIAEEASEISGDMDNHFWSDSNGVHVADVEQDAWDTAVSSGFSDYDEDTKPYRNILVGRLGILLRSCLNNLVSISRSAIAFFDGGGNSSSNIVARFGTDGAQVGRDSSTHITLDSDGTTFFSELIYNDFGTGSKTVFTVSQTAVEITEVTVDGAAVGFSSSGNVVTLDEAPAAGASVEIKYIELTMSVGKGELDNGVYFPAKTSFGMNASITNGQYDELHVDGGNSMALSAGMLGDPNYSLVEIDMGSSGYISANARHLNGAESDFAAGWVANGPREQLTLVGGKTVTLNDGGLNMATNIHPTSNPSEAIWAGVIGWRNSADTNWVTYFQPSQATNGAQSLSIGVRTLNGSTVHTHSINLSVAKDGSTAVILDKDAWLNALGLKTTSWAYLYGSSSSSDKYVRYRACAGIVFVEWYYSTGAGATSAGVSFGTLPSGFRPSKRVDGSCCGTGNNVLWYDISTGGVIKVGTRASSTSSAAYGSASFPIA